jgi:hypothetical protein
MYAKIDPVTYRTGQAKCLVVRNTSIQLGDRAIVEWSLMGDQATDRRDYESGGTMMSGNDYSVWGQDDSYVYEWLATQLSVTINSMSDKSYWDTTPEPAPEPEPV